MHTNPYAQAGWSNPDNPLSIYNETWGSHAEPPPSIYGALPSVTPPSPPRILTFHFVSWSPDVLNSIVIGPQSKKYFDIETNSPDMGASTVLKKAGQPFAVIDWTTQPSVEIYGIVPRQAAGQFMELSRDQSYRTIQVYEKWYTWIPHEQTYSLFTVSLDQPELLAQVSWETDMLKLEITVDAVQTGLLEVVVACTVLLRSGRNFV